MSGNGRMALPDVREYSGGPHGCPEVVERLCRMSGSGQEALSDVLEWSKALTDARKWSKGYPECPRMVG